MNLENNVLKNYTSFKLPVSTRLSEMQRKSKRSFIMSFLFQLNRATYNILLDVSPIVDTENNVLQHYLASDLVQLGLWGNVVEKNMRVKVGILE